MRKIDNNCRGSWIEESVISDRRGGKGKEEEKKTIAKLIIFGNKNWD